VKEAVIWHDVECGPYTADLPLWEELAAAADGPVLELGCGTGRVARRLAELGHDVTGLDGDEELLAELERRGGVRAEHADAGSFSLGREFALILAPMQVVQLLPGAEARRACLGCVHGHLAPGSLAAFALVESIPSAEPGRPPLPDVRDVDGWVYSSLPIDTVSDGGSIAVRRLRQVVSPEGGLRDEECVVRLRSLTAARLEEEAVGAGLEAAGRRALLPTEDHVGSTVVLLRRSA
jgi:SAM-dependent methyltransferase